MKPLAPNDLMSLEDYARERADFRARVMAHKAHRRVPLGPNFTLYFEDRLTIQYQVQEMLRAERIFEPKGIKEELETYNPLIPDGSNLKATAMFEFEDKAERQKRLGELVGVEHHIWAQVEGQDRAPAIANEDLERSTEKKTSAVHFLRFEFDRDSIAALRDGASLKFGIDHDDYRHEISVEGKTLEALIQDLD
jgi:hypothetical protein